MRTFLAFIYDQEGATTIEYAFLAAFIAIAAFAAIQNLATAVNNSFTDTAGKVTAAGR